MSADRPWEAGPFSSWVIEELNKRVNGISSGINQTINSETINYNSGPRRHWIRAFSSGFVKEVDTNDSWGLILKSGDSFSSRYGIAPQQQIYGYNNTETPKYITSNQYRINVPEPGITSFTADVQKNFFITAKLNWVCHSIDQLNAITPYFLTPLTTVFVEWGWNIFNINSLLNYKEEAYLKEIVENHFKHYQERVPLSKGNYEFMVGEITNFEYTVDENLIKGFTEIRSRQMSWSGFNIRGAKNVATKVGEGGSSVSPALDFKTVCQQILSGLQLKSDNFDPKLRPNQIQGRVLRKLSQEEKNGITALLNILQNITSNGKPKYGERGADVSKYIYKLINTTDPNNSKQDDGSKNLMDTYITFELFADILNALKDQHTTNTSLKNYATVDVDTDVGYHGNLISTSKNVLIPNIRAPKFNGKGSVPYDSQDCDAETKFIEDIDNLAKSESTTTALFFDEVKDRLVGSTALQNSALVTIGNKLGITNINVNPPTEREKGQDKKVFMIEEDAGPGTILNPGKGDNSTLKLLVLYRGKIYRNNLDAVLNKYGRTNYRENSGFGAETRSDEYLSRFPNAKNKITPNIKNVYINLNFIKDSIVNNEDVIDMESVYNIILKELNESVCDFWNLELVNVDTDGTNGSRTRLKVIDRKRFNEKIPPAYVFEYGSSNSIIKKINFTTTLTNAQANQILYRSFGNTSLSTNNMIDFTGGGRYKDKLKTSGKRDNTERPSQIILTFLNVISKYVKFNESDPSGNLLLRVKVYGTKEQKNNNRIRAPKTTTVIDDKKYNIVDLYIPDKEALVYMLNDNDITKNTNVYCAPIRNVEIEISLMGIAGIRVFEYFKIKNLPPPFTDNVVVFQVRDVNHTVDENGWETRIKASLRPAYNLQQYIGDVNINPAFQYIA